MIAIFYIFVFVMALFIGWVISIIGDNLEINHTFVLYLCLVVGYIWGKGCLKFRDKVFKNRVK